MITKIDREGDMWVVTWHDGRTYKFADIEDIGGVITFFNQQTYSTVDGATFRSAARAAQYATELAALEEEARREITTDLVARKVKERAGVLRARLEFEEKIEDAVLAAGGTEEMAAWLIAHPGFLLVESRQMRAGSSWLGVEDNELYRAYGSFLSLMAARFNRSKGAIGSRIYGALKNGTLR